MAGGDVQSTHPKHQILIDDPIVKDGSMEVASSKLLSERKDEIEAAALFYQNHLDRITSLVNVSTGIVWEPTSRQHAFRPFLDAFPDLYTVPRGDKHFNLNLAASPKYIHWKDVCQAAHAFRIYHQNATSPPIPHVLILALDENWGAFSSAIPNKTASWSRSLEHKWNKTGCSPDDIAAYLDHPDTRAIVTTQFQDYDHPKVHSLPLGVTSPDKLTKILQVLQTTHRDNHTVKSNLGLPRLLHDNEQEMIATNATTTRPQLLMVNCQQRGMRNASVTTVIQNFDGTVQNTFQAKGGGSYKDFLTEMSQSKFILSPGGIGLDCYRHWEAIMIGTIPVMEHLNRTDGWRRSFLDLPVAWIDSYDNLTPQFLEQEYARIIQLADSFKYEKLTKAWWIQMVQSKV